MPGFTFSLAGVICPVGLGAQRRILGGATTLLSSLTQQQPGTESVTLGAGLRWSPDAKNTIK